MNVDLNELIKTIAENLNLKDFKGDIVAVKTVENEIGTMEDGAILVQNNYYGADAKTTEQTHANGKEERAEELSLIDRMLIAIRSMVDANEINDKQEFAAIYKIVTERVNPDIKRGEFCRIVNANIVMNDRIRPSDDNIRKVIFSKNSKYPDWKITGFGVEQLFRYQNLAKSFLSHYCK